jgi:hypothetical protein
LFFTGDTNTGLFSPGADTVALATAGSNRLHITSGGLVGLGTSSPSAALAFADTTSTAGDPSKIALFSAVGIPLYGFGVSASQLDYVTGGSHVFYSRTGSTSTERIRIDSSGRVGIGTTSPGYKLAVFGTADNEEIIHVGNTAGTTDGTATNQLRFTCNGSGSWANVRHNAYSHRWGFGGNASVNEAARIDSSGRLLVGTSTAATTAGTISAVQIFRNNLSEMLNLHLGFNGAAAGARINLSRSRNATHGSFTILQSGDEIGGISFIGDDGVDYDSIAARIYAEVDGTPGANDMPGRLIFSVTRDGAASPTEALRISNTGAVTHSCNRADWGFETKNQNNSSSNYGLAISCGTNAATGTNYAVNIADGDNDNQGYITFTGGTVTYGAFTAHHPCILPDADNEAGYPYGTLLETTSIEYTQKDGHNTERGILYNVCKTQAANSRAVLGAYGSSMNGGPNGETNRHQALVLGDGHILCNNSGGNIKVGDGICSSATPGIGQKATATPSMAIGIAQEDVTFADDEEVKLVAVQYGVRQFIPWGE